MRSLLVTGGAGFIGSNFIHYFLESQKDCRVINLDALTYAGNIDNIEDLKQNKRHIFIKGDIGDRKLLGKVFDQYEIDSVVNFAAESHVDRSITSPEVFLTTNILGTQALLDTARSFWAIGTDERGLISYKDGVKFVQVSTDEVYGSLGPEGLFTEETSLQPNSPYSASKASADLVVRAYYKTFGLPVNITRCSNNYGPYQFPEKLIPLMALNCMQNKPLPVYGDGLQIRDWLYVEDHCSAIEAVLLKGRIGEVYNVGGNNEKANLEIVKKVVSSLGRDESLIEYVTDRLGHDRRYAIDNTKIANDLGWTPQYSFDSGMEKTMSWYKDNTLWLDRVFSGKYREGVY